MFGLESVISGELLHVRVDLVGKGSLRTPTLALGTSVLRSFLLLSSSNLEC